MCKMALLLCFVRVYESVLLLLSLSLPKAIRVIPLSIFIILSDYVLSYNNIVESARYRRTVTEDQYVYTFVYCGSTRQCTAFSGRL